jgi:hypothetical protein
MSQPLLGRQSHVRNSTLNSTTRLYFITRYNNILHSSRGLGREIDYGKQPYIFIIVNFSGVRESPLGTAATTGLL